MVRNADDLPEMVELFIEKLGEVSGGMVIRPPELTTNYYGEESCGAPPRGGIGGPPYTTLALGEECVGGPTTASTLEDPL